MGIWHQFQYLVVEDDIIGFINKWPSEWLTPYDTSTRTSKVTEGEIEKTTTMKAIAKDKKKDAQKASAKEKVVQKEAVMQEKEASIKEKEVPK